MPANVIEVSGVHKAFDIPSAHRHTIREHLFGLLRPREFERLVVLDGVSFEVQQGETLGIMGRNGSGKSTLLKILCGIYQADRGDVRTLSPVTPVLELGIGWNPELNAVDNILLIATVMGIPLRDAETSVDKVLAFAELERFAELELKHYSTGMASRLAYSVAFNSARDVLVIDEVFAVGDAGFKARCEQRYRELAAEGCTVLLVSHDPRHVREFCNRALLLERGRIVTEGTGAQVVDAYLSEFANPRAGDSA